MKVAVYYDLPPGGALVHTLGFLKALRRDHQVEVFIPAPPPASSRLMRDLQAFFWSRHAARELADRINANFDVAYVTHDRFFQAPWILRYLTIPTLHYSHNPTRAFFEKELGIDPSWPLPNRLYETFLRFCKKKLEVSSARAATMLVTSSRYMVDYLQNAYSRSSELAYPGVNMRVFRPLRLKKLKQIVLVGNDESQKSLALALDSLALIPESIRPTLAIASPRRRVGARVIKLARQKHIKLKVYCALTPPLLNRLYNTSLLTLSTALREPFGLSIVESLAAGTPVVATREGGFIETVRDKHDGVLVARDKENFAQGITFALTHLEDFRPHCRFELNASNRTLLTYLSRLPKYPR